MTASSVIEENLIKDLSSLDLSTLFPSSIKYPNQTIPALPNIPHQKQKYKYSFSSKQTTISFVPNGILYGICVYSNVLGAVGEQTLKIYDLKEIKEVFYFSVPDDELYCLSIAENTHNSSLYCAIGGQNPIIRIVDILKGEEVTTLIGHKNEIYDLKFNLSNSDLLLSASKDTSIRLWNIKNQAQLCIFGGPLGHAAEVLSIAWHDSGNYFVSGGIDNCIKIYEMNPKIKKRIEDSYNNLAVSTLLKSNPLFSCATIHDNYIDCVQFNGNLVMSKSVDGIIKEWLPMFNKESDFFYLINAYIYDIKETIWYIKYCIDPIDNILLIGNDEGKCFLFQLIDDASVSNDSKVKEDDRINTKPDCIIRGIGYSSELKMAVFGSSKGELVFTSILKEEIHN